MLPRHEVPGAPPLRRQRTDKPGGKLARELLWDVSRGDPWSFYTDLFLYKRGNLKEYCIPKRKNSTMSLTNLIWF